MPKSGQYALEAAVAERVLNRLLNLLVSSGRFPTTFHSSGGSADETILFSESHVIELKIDKIEVFTETGAARKLGLHVEFSAGVTTALNFKEWRDATTNAVIDPALEENFSIPIQGSFDAIGQLLIQTAAERQHVVLSFASLKELKFIRIGDLIPGKDFTELMRVLIERIAVSELRLSYTLPSLAGIPASMPYPVGSILDLQCAELGSVDFKVCDASGDSSDDFHVLMQTALNRGDERFSAVNERSSTSTDLTLAISSKFIGQVKQELWQNRLIPRKFNDQGMPDTNGRNEITYLSLTPRASGFLGFRIEMRRPFLAGHVNGKVLMEVHPYIENGLLRLELKSEDISVEWAKSPGRSAIFMLLYEVMLTSVFRGVDLLIDGWTDSLLRDFIDDLSINVTQRFKWQELGVSVLIEPHTFKVSDLEIACAVKVKFN